MSWECLNGNILPFSYTVTIPIYRYDHDPRIAEETNYHQWLISDKGSEKSKINYNNIFMKENIRLALTEIKTHMTGRMPIFMSLLCRNLDFHIYLKGEFEIESMDSVKIRGVIYTLLKLSDEQKRKGVIAISTGSFAWFLCYYGNKFKIPVIVVMPESTAEEKAQKCRDLGAAEVIVWGSDMVDAHKIALRTAMTRGLFYLDGNDHPNMIIGQATVGIEIFELSPEEIELGMMQFDAVILPTAIDGCGLTMAIALTIKQWDKNIKVFEVLPTNPDLFIQNVRVQHTSVPDELSKLGIKNIPAETYFGYELPYNCMIEEYFDGRIKVNEKEIQDAADHLLKVEHIIDSNAAIGIAAILSGKLNMLKGKRVLLLMYGNMDSSTELTQNRQQSSLEPRAGPSRMQ